MHTVIVKIKVKAKDESKLPDWGLGKGILADSCVYHIEHSRDENSSTLNPHFANNDALMTCLRNMPNPEIIEYYKNVSYIKKYLKK